MKRRSAALPEEFLRRCQAVTAKRPRTVIQHILQHGHITSEELKEKYGYNHPPRAVRDVKDQGIPIAMFRVTGSDGRKIAAYGFGDPAQLSTTGFTGRKALPRALKRKLIERHGPRCAIYAEVFPERELQVDHRIPFAVTGDISPAELDPRDFMLLSASANRAKSWSCEQCRNWRETKDRSVCARCYWASPENYTHVALREERRVDIVWSETETEAHDRLQHAAKSAGSTLPVYVKAILARLVQ